MPVTVKIEDKAKKLAAEAIAAAPDLSDYATPDERSEGTKAFLIWFVAMLLLSVGLIAAPGTQLVGLVIALWWIVSCAIYFYFMPRAMLRRLHEQGAAVRIAAKNQPRLHTLLSKGSAMIGVAEPAGFLVNEPFSQVRIANFGGDFVVVTQAASDLLEPAELDCLVIRAMVHSRQNHVRRLMIIQLLADTPPALRFLAWPVSFYAGMLRMNWSDLAEQTADRLALLVIKHEKLLMSALLKQFSASDPLMRENNVTTQEIDSYITQGGKIDMSGSTVSTDYKIGSSIQANPYLEERVNALRAWAASKEFRAALAKLAEEKAKNTAK